MDSLKILRLWAGAAWADDVLHPAEAAALRRFIDAADDLSKVDRDAALRLLDARPAIDVAEVAALDPITRQGVYRAVLGIIKLDGKVTPDEEEWVAKLRARLDLDAATLARIAGET